MMLKITKNLMILLKYGLIVAPRIVLYWRKEDLKWPADMYLGIDQHRGWFHSSLLGSCGTRGKAPFKSILSHGFVVDDKGMKMSKSMGNVISPEDILKNYGRYS